MKSIYQNFFRTASLFFLGLVLATGLFELFLRTTELMPQFRFLPVAQASFYAPDNEVGFSLRPNAKGFWDTENRSYIEINSLGYRGQEPGKDGIDIAFVGHSLTEALQVEEDKTFTYLVGRQLGAETANLGISGAPPAVVVGQLRKFLPTLKPKMIVIVVETRFFEQDTVLQDTAYVGYKITDDDKSADLSYGFRQTRGYKIRTSKIGDIIYWALDNSRVANVLNNTLNRGLFRGVHELRASNVLDRENKISIGTQESFFNLWRKSEPKNHRLALEAFLEDLSELQAQYKTKVIIAITVPWEEADVPTLKAMDHEMGVMMNRYGLDIVNLTPFIQAQFPENVTSMAFKGFDPPFRGGHLNESGHLIYAKALEKIIKERSPGQ